MNYGSPLIPFLKARKLGWRTRRPREGVVVLRRPQANTVIPRDREPYTSLVLVVGEIAQKTIPQDPRDARVCRMKTLPDPALGVVGKVLCVVDPPSPIIIP